MATMSDSSIALKPVIDEPSKPIPSSSASSTSAGVMAKLFRWPSMSVNQRRRYSTPSSSICLSACFRASGSDVARALLSIIAIVSGAPLRRGLPEVLSPRERKRRADDDDDVAIDVAERAVEPLHRLVAGLRPGVDLSETALGCALERALLQRAADPATPDVAAHGRQRVLRPLRPIRVVEQPGHADELAVDQRDERPLGRRKPLAPPALLRDLERPVEHEVAERLGDELRVEMRAQVVAPAQ